MHTTHRSGPSLPAELQTLRDACPLLETTTYLANCSQGPLSVPVRTAAQNFLDGWDKMGMHWDVWGEEVERARATFAMLIGASPEDIAVGTSVSQIASSLASALLISPHLTCRRLVSSVVEFPGVAHAWLAMRKHGWQVDLLARDDEGMVNADHFVAALDEPTTLISVPHVCYANGALTDLEPIITTAHAQGSFVFVDAYQSIGTVPIDVKASGIDFLAAGTLKYLLGTAGIAFLYVNPALLEQLEPTFTGWFGRKNPYAFDSSLLDYADDAARFDLGTPPIVNAYIARAGMELVLNVGVERIRKHIERLSTLVYDVAAQLSMRIVSPKQVARKGSITSLDAGSPERALQVENELRRRAIVVAARGSLIRLAPHGFTHEQELERALHTVAQVLHAS